MKKNTRIPENAGTKVRAKNYNTNTVARFHELRKKVDYPTSTSPLFLICWCGVRSSLAVDGEPSEPCAICSRSIDGGAT